MKGVDVSVDLVWLAGLFVSLFVYVAVSKFVVYLVLLVGSVCTSLLLFRVFDP